MTAATSHILSQSPPLQRQGGLLQAAHAGGRMRRRVQHVLIVLAVCLPIPVLAATGLAVPLPGIVERLAVALVPWAEATTLEASATPAARGSIVLAPGEGSGGQAEDPQARPDFRPSTVPASAAGESAGGRRGENGSGTGAGSTGSGGGGTDPGETQPGTGGGTEPAPTSPTDTLTGQVEETADDVAETGGSVIDGTTDTVDETSGAVNDVVSGLGK
jgi:hypothetical protein